MDLEKKRLALHQYLREVSGLTACYYSPPSGIEMEYPCVVYSLTGQDSTFADNIRYLSTLEWSIVVIDEDADSKIANRFLNLKNCRFDRSYASVDLNHFSFTLNY